MPDAGRAIGDVMPRITVVWQCSPDGPPKAVGRYQCGDYTEGLRRKGKYSWGRASGKADGGDSGGNAAERGSEKDAAGAGKGISWQVTRSIRARRGP